MNGRGCSDVCWLERLKDSGKLGRGSPRVAGGIEGQINNVINNDSHNT